MLISGLVASKSQQLSSPLPPPSPPAANGESNYKKMYEMALEELNSLKSSSDGSKRLRRKLVEIPQNIKWLPTCDKAIGARYVPDKIYTDPG